MFKKEQQNDAIYFAKKIKELNYEISLNPVSITRYSKEEFIDLINKANKLEPYFFYMVDTYGLMNEIETLEYFNLLEKHLDKSIQIGYHVHDNLQLAFKNAIEAGRKAYLSGLGRVLTRGASASDPLTGFLRD